MDRFEITVNGKPGKTIDISESRLLDIVRLSESEYHCTNNHRSYHAVIKKFDPLHKLVELTLNGKTFSCQINEPLDLTLKSLNLNNRSKNINKNLISNMPGMVLEVLVKVGQQVVKDEALMILEAMKMENILKAGVDGRVDKICCAENEAVEKGQLLIEIS